MYIPASLQQELEWWHSNIGSGQDLKPRDFSVEINSDASRTGWGAFCQGSRCHGFWNNEEQLMQINYLEIKAVKMLQSVSINFTIAVEHLDKLKDTIEKFRTDEHFRVVLSEASQLGQSLGVEDNFPIEGDVRRRKKKKQFDYEAEDENISCPENNFRINFFFAVSDTTIKLYQKDFSNLRLTSYHTSPPDTRMKACPLVHISWTNKGVVDLLTHQRFVLDEKKLNSS
nr:unnamed protein product [Callosobruchus chinensis]